MNAGNGSSGLSRASAKAMETANRLPSPVLPMPAIPLTTGLSQDIDITFPGLNFRKDTAVVFVPDSADVDAGETVEITSRVVVPSQAGELGTIQVLATFANIPAGPVTDYYQVFLTGSLGGRRFLGTVTVNP